MSQRKNAIVTGSTSGIGLGIATALAKNGMNIMLNGFGDTLVIEQIRKNLSDTYGVQVVYSAADMSCSESIASMVAQAIESFGQIDVVVNNAGILHVAPVDEFPAEKWDAIMAINLSSAFHTTKRALPGMKAQGWGRIINTGSMHSKVASPYKSAYNAAKHAISGFSKTIALEVAQQGITVNTICPGYTWTPLIEGQIPATMEVRGLSREEVINDVLLAPQPTKEFVQIEQLGALAVFLCKDEARSITGTDISMDGGWTAQ